MDGHQRLAVAVLRAAVDDLHDRRPAVHDQARAWLLSDAAAHWCHVAGFDPSFVKTRVERMAAMTLDFGRGARQS